MAQENKQSRYLEYLPAIYHQDPVDPQDPNPPVGSYLGQFLLPFEEVLAGFEHILSTIDDRISSALAPDDSLSWLAGWVALALDDNWDESKQRRLIRDAVRLYRRRGMIAGLQDYLRIYDERLIPKIREGRWPGGMQIGVASQIGGLTPAHVPLTRIQRVERRHPPVFYDYYVIDTIASAGHPHVPEGQPLRLYHRADRVKSVHVVDKNPADKNPVDKNPADKNPRDESGKTFVRLELVNGESRLYEPATVARSDQIVDERYTITVDSNSDSPDENPADENPADQSPRATEAGQNYYRGGSFLIDDLELPYGFTLEIQVPCRDWEFVFRFQLASIESALPDAFWQELEIQGISLSKDASVAVDGQGLRWWRIEDGDPEMGGQADENPIVIAVRQGIYLDVYRWTGCKAWQEARDPHNVQEIRAIVDQVKPAHTTYYLRLTPLESEFVLQPMQVGVRSRIDVDARIG